MNLAESLGSISGKPETSYFIERFAKSSQFSNQIIPLQLDTAVNFGEEFTIDIYQEGDLVTAAYLEFTYPQGKPSAVCDSFGTYMLDWIQLEYGNQIIERIYGEFLEMMSDITVPQGKQGALSNLTGKYLTSNLAVYDVRLSFDMFNRGLPICALKENPRIRVSLRNFYEGCPTATNVNPPFTATLFVNYVFLPETERNYFIKTPLTYLFEQSQRFDTVLPTSNCTVYTDFVNPTKELFFVLQTPTDLPYQWTDQLTSMRFLLNNAEVITYDMGTSLFMRYLQPLENHTRAPDRVFYMYPFALDPENDNPTGSVNMCGVRQQVDFNLISSLSLRILHMYSRSYNVLKIQDGFLRVLFPVPFISSGKMNIGNYNQASLTNPGALVLYTGDSSTSRTINLVGTTTPVTWTYPTISGVTWTPSSTSLTFVIAQNAVISTQNVTVTATSGTTSMSTTFSLFASNTPAYVLSNPGTTTLYTLNSLQILVLTLTNPLNLTPTWTALPTVTGATWSYTNTGATLTAPQGTSFATATITVTASYGASSYPQAFSLTINNTPAFVLSNPGTTTLYTLNSLQILVLTLTNPLNLTPTWTALPTVTGATWSYTNTGATLTAPQGTSFATATITVTASYGASSYPQAFSLTITNTAPPVINGTVTTFAGSLGASAYLNGTGTAARFTDPAAICYDGTGNLYVTDFSYTIRKIVISTAVVSTICGNPGVAGTTDGTGSGATLWSPFQLCFDGVNTLYFVDSFANIVRKVVISTGTVTTIAGQAFTAGSTDGIGTAALFNAPFGVIYLAGSPAYLYISDFNNQTIRRMNLSTNAVTTIAGQVGVAGSANGTGTSAQFNGPNGLIIDPSNTYLYISDYNNQTIRRMNLSTNAVTTIAGQVGVAGSADGIGTAAQFNSPQYITIDTVGSYMYVADGSNQTIRRINLSTNAVVTIAGLAGTSGAADGTGTTARFNGPIGAVYAASKLYVVDENNFAVRAIV